MGCSTERGAFGSYLREGDGRRGRTERRCSRRVCVCHSRFVMIRSRERSRRSRHPVRSPFLCAKKRNLECGTFVFRARSSPIGSRRGAAPRASRSQFHTREPLSTRRRTRRDSHHVRPRLGCVSRFDARVSRIPPGATPRARDAERRATPVAAANFAFLARLKSRVPRRAGRRGSLLASRRVPLTAVPPLRARAATPRSPKRQTTRSSRSPTSPPRPRRRRRSRPIPASRTKMRRNPR